MGMTTVKLGGRARLNHPVHSTAATTIVAAAAEHEAKLTPAAVKRTEVAFSVQAPMTDTNGPRGTARCLRAGATYGCWV